jgi:exopolysaccharide production protein ExoZ
MPLETVNGGADPVITVSWTLEYEVAFYALFALAIINRWLMAIALVLVLTTYVSCSSGCGYPLSFVATNITPLFGIGAIVAVLERKGWAVRSPIAIVSAATIFFFSFGIAEIVDLSFRSTALQRTLLGCASGLIIAGLVTWEKGRSNKPDLGRLGLLGDASYVLYLVHYPVISSLCKLSMRILPHTIVGASIAYTIILVACLGIAIGIHLWIEKPLLSSLRTNHRAAVVSSRG